MKEIDFEKIRKDVAGKYTKNLGISNVDKLLEKQVEVISKVTADMLKAYHQALPESDR